MENESFNERRIYLGKVRGVWRGAVVVVAHECELLNTIELKSG